MKSIKLKEKLMRQKTKRNERYKTLTKDWLKSIGVDVMLDGISTKDIPTEFLKRFCEHYENARGEAVQQQIQEMDLQDAYGQHRDA